jgi:hypothetical protein
MAQLVNVRHPTTTTLSSGGQYFIKLNIRDWRYSYDTVMKAYGSPISKSGTEGRVCVCVCGQLNYCNVRRFKENDRVKQGFQFGIMPLGW